MNLHCGTIEVKNLRSFLKKIPEGCVFIDADYVLSTDTVEFAVRKATDSWKRGKRVSKNLSMEILLHFSATRQINQAVRAGLKEGLNRVVVVELSPCQDFLHDHNFRECSVLKTDREKLRRIAEFYGIEEEEIKITGWEKLDLLVRERIALFSISK